MKRMKHVTGIMIFVALGWNIKLLAADETHSKESKGNPSRSTANPEEFEKSYSDLLQQIKLAKGLKEANLGFINPGKAPDFIDVDKFEESIVKLRDEHRKKMQTWCSESDGDQASVLFAKRLDWFMDYLAKGMAEPPLEPGQSKAAVLENRGMNKELYNADKAKAYILFFKKFMLEKASKLKSGDEQLEKDKEFVKYITWIQNQLGIETSVEEVTAFDAAADGQEKMKEALEKQKEDDQVACLYRKSTATGPAGKKEETAKTEEEKKAGETAKAEQAKKDAEAKAKAEQEARDERGRASLPPDGTVDPTVVAENGAEGTDESIPDDGGNGQSEPSVPGYQDNANQVAELQAAVEALKQALLNDNNDEDFEDQRLKDELRALQDQLLAQQELDRVNDQLDDNNNDDLLKNLKNIGDKQGGNKTEAAEAPFIPPSIPPINAGGQGGPEPYQPEDLPPPPPPPFMPVGLGPTLQGAGSGGTTIITDTARVKDEFKPLRPDPYLGMLKAQQKGQDEYFKFMRTMMTGGMGVPYGRPPYPAGQQQQQGGFAQRLSTRTYGGAAGGRAPVFGAASTAGAATGTGAVPMNSGARSRTLPAALAGR